MSRHTTDVQESAEDCAPSPPLPADHVFNSGAVLFPGAFDQHGCPLIVFPVDAQDGLSSDLSKAEVVDFINYFLCVHNKKQEKDGLVSVVADLRQASLQTTRFIAETLLLLELHKRTVHSVYMIQPKRKDALKLLLKLLSPSKSYNTSFKKVLLKEISELSNYIDRSQLTAPLGGYLVYCHHSWVAFIKEIDVFVQEFLSVVQRLPSSISTLQALSRLPLPSTLSELQHFCGTNEAKFQQLRRDLGLDDLLTHCEKILEKLRYPEKEACYQAMAGTALFTHTAFDMLQNHSRITAAVEKVELLWQQAFSKARLQLQVCQLRGDSLQVTEQIKTLFEDKLHPYKIDVAQDAAKAARLVSEFEASIHTPAMALVRCAEDVIHTLSEVLLCDGQPAERWALDLERLKEKLHSAVVFILQTLRAVSSFHHYYNKARSWYHLVLCENFLQELLSGVNGGAGGDTAQRQRRNRGTIPAWRHKLSMFLKKNPSPDLEELVHLAHLSSVIPEDEVQQSGRQMSQRCMTLRKLLLSSGPVPVGHLQQALQWQYELLRSGQVHHSSNDGDTKRTNQDVPDPSKCESVKEEAAHLLTASPAAAGVVLAEGKPASLSSFDSGFDGAGSSPLEIRDCVRPVQSRPQTHRENLCSVSDCEDLRDEFDFGSVGNSSRASIQIIPKVCVESLNFEIKVKRSAALPSNPWLSLPVDDLENSYTVTITQNATPQKRDPQPPLQPCSESNRSLRDQPTQTEVLNSSQPQIRDWILNSQSGLDDPELSPIRNILSSTITEQRDMSACTEGVPTLLWDSYDLHNQEQDSADRLIDVSLKDWDVKEQEGLMEVEKILDRADQILEKEEKVLAQEAVLDALLRSEVRPVQWPLWDSEEQPGVMSSSELAEAGVLGLDDYIDPAGLGNLSEPRSAGTKAPEEDADTGADAGTFPSGSDLLTELRQVQVLDELIMEENLKIQELRRYEEKPKEESKPLDSNGPLSVSKEREAFRLQVEKEKREVEKLEKSLDKERKMKKHKRRATKVIKCSVMEKARSESTEDRALCHEILSGNRSQRTALVRSDSQDAQDDSRTEAESCPEVSKDASQLPDSQCQDHPSEAELTGSNKTTFLSSSDLKEPSEEVGIQPQEEGTNRKEMDGSGENFNNICKPEASLTPQMRPDDGAFDPGGHPHLPPVPKPIISSLPVNNNLTEPEAPPSTELQSPTLSSASDRGLMQSDRRDEEVDALPESLTPEISLVLNPNVKEHSNNNNNNHADPEVSSSELTPDDEEDSPVGPACLLQTDLPHAEEVEAADGIPLQPAPDRALQEFNHRRRDEQSEDLTDGVQRSDAMRTSGPVTPGIQAQLDISTREMTDFKTPIVLDTGSGLMKAGFADQDLPNIIFPTIIGSPKYEEIMNGNLERDTYIGHEAQHMRGVLALKHPIKNGIIRNWDDMEKIWHHTFQQLGVDPEDHPVLITEAAMNPLQNRQRMVEIMFECFCVPFTYVAMQAVLALYAAGKSTGVVFDSGDGVSHSVPVFEGYSLPHAVQRFPLAGVDVTMHLKKLLQEQGVCMRTTAEMEIVREMKEKCCCVALNYESELSRGRSSCREMHYTMPDGQIVTLGTERFRAPEILFKPELIGRDHYGIHESVFKSILSSDIDLRRCFLGNIVLSGGNTLLDGLPERLQAEIKGLVPPDTGESVHVTSPKDRDFSVWRGGAVLANLPTFSSAWISHEEYEEYGPQIIFRKCF
ncbi:uncharacterized protein LOC132985323 isoform X2 [Labrus mixtus]|uniref:uncharacterized protein LOC132985323 isoform X2 n=1 Tax=Labrus mixtus TaxID=508554 RepID=UPI0029BFD273|nr:uncharacterized protein LOC132985323 isoform X2 [Labrus mixtus]